PLGWSTGRRGISRFIKDLGFSPGEFAAAGETGYARRGRESGEDWMLREAFSERLKEAMRAKETRTLSTVRLIIAALKDRDVAARGTGNTEGIAESEIQRMLQGMVKQRRESIVLYRQGNRPELARQEEEEIAIIESFLP